MLAEYVRRPGAGRTENNQHQVGRDVFGLGLLLSPPLPRLSVVISG